MKNKKVRLRGQADKLWFQVCLKDNCESCGGRAIQAHHFYYKSNYGHLRYEIDNGVSLCKVCHFLLHHQDPKRIEDRIIAKRGQEWFDKLKEQAYKLPPPSYLTIDYYQRQIERLSQVLKNL